MEKCGSDRLRQAARSRSSPRRTAHDGVALVTLDRPEVLNALDYQTLGELVAALEELDWR